RRDSSCWYSKMRNVDKTSTVLKQTKNSDYADK
ncbi:23S rRNA methyltransferase attenuation leader peptide, partial [Clostridium sp. AF21-20LB]